METPLSLPRSFCSPAHYEWAAHIRDGMCLTYLFGMSLLLFALLWAGGYYYLGSDLVQKLVALGDKVSSDKLFILPNHTWSYNASMIFWWSVTGVAMMFVLLNLAIVYALYGQLFNYGLRTEFDFLQMVRIAAYAEIPALILSATGLWLVYKSGTIPDISFAVAWSMTVFTLYILFGIFSARNPE